MPRVKKAAPASCVEQTSFAGLTRSQLMARVRSSGNKTTEERFRRVLREMCIAGWRRNYPLPGRPDFVWPRAKLAVFVDGCFWHGHACGRNLTPRTNVAFWTKKIQGNCGRDRRVNRELRRRGWTVVRVWECALRRAPDRVGAALLRRLAELRLHSK